MGAEINEERVDIEEYLAEMSDEAKTALVGLLRAADKLNGWAWNARAAGHGWLNFRRNTREPDNLLTEIFDNASVIRRDIAEVTVTPELRRLWDSA